MKSEWIYKYQVEQEGDKTIISGNFSASSGEFKIEYCGDGGNADMYQFTLSGNQYDDQKGKPTTFTITGAWEIREVIDMFKLLGAVHNSPTQTKPDVI